MHLDDILDGAELERLIAEHYISRAAHPSLPLALLNYSEKATYDRVWTPETRQCRGLVYEVGTREIVAWPFNKFHNVGETPETGLEALAARPGAVEATDKLDGSMIALWHYQDAWHTSTRGSFVSAQAYAAASWLARPRGVPTWEWDSAYTYLAEWTAPSNRVVLKYDEPALTLIGARHIHAGHDADYTHLSLLGALIDLPVVATVPGADLETLIARTPFERGIEGWVVRWPDGFRVKVKCEDYLRLHRLFSGFGPGRIREAILAGNADRYLLELPEELRPEAESIIVAIARATEARTASLRASYAQIAPLLAESRKAFALAVQQQPTEDRGYLFSLADGKPVDEKILKALDLVGLFGETAELAL